MASRLAQRGTEKAAAKKTAVNTGVRTGVRGSDALTTSILATPIARAESGSKSREQVGIGA
jgi:hypothetical protein